MPGDSSPLDLSEVALFQELTEQQLCAVRSLLRPQSLRAGSVLIAEEEPGDAAYIILRGSVKILARGAESSSVLIAIRGPGEIVGEMSLLDDLGRSATVIAQEECELLRLGREDFREHLREVPAIAYNLTRILSSRLRLLTVRAQIFSSQDVRGRVAHQLLAFAREYGRPTEAGVLIPFRLTQSDLSSMIGASRLRVNQVFSYWKRHEHITVDQSQRITIRSQAALERACV